MGWSDAPATGNAPTYSGAPTYSQSNDAEYMRKRLEDLAKQGELSPGESETLKRLQAVAPQNAANVGAGNATYRGFAAGATMNARDEVADFLGMDGTGIRARDAEAQNAYPTEFGRGRFSGGVASTVLPGIGAGKLAQGASMGVKTALYGVTGALNGGFSGFMDGQGASGFSAGDLSQRISAARMPALIGAGLGAAAPWAGKGVGALASLIANRARATGSMSARAVGAIRQPLADSAGAVGDIQAYLKSLGPEAMIADVPGPLQSQAMALAAMQGRGGAEITSAVNARARGAGPRIESVMDQNITGPNAAFDMARAEAEKRASVFGPEYDAALKAPGMVRTDRVAETYDPNAIGAPAAAFNDVRTKIGRPENVIGPYSGVAPAPLVHNVRSDLSDTISEAARAGRGGFVAQTKPILGALDDVLNSVPGYAAARSGWANSKAMDRAIELGQDALKGGRAGASSPAEFKVMFDKLSDAEKEAFKAGMRRDVAAVMGTSKNAPAAAWGEFGKQWNEEKLRIALGSEAEPIIQRLKAEHVFSETRGRIDQGSMTARRTEATRGLDAANPEKTGMMTGPLTGGMNAIYKKVVDPISFGPRRSNLNAELGRFYTSNGPEAQMLVQNILKQSQLKGKKATALSELLIRSLVLGGAGAAPSIAPQ